MREEQPIFTRYYRITKQANNKNKFLSLLTKQDILHIPEVRAFIVEIVEDPSNSLNEEQKQKFKKIKKKIYNQM